MADYEQGGGEMHLVEMDQAVILACIGYHYIAVDCSFASV